ncbi:hypothetical protein ABPG75_013731 [Micractinium tetrahymenae]
MAMRATSPLAALLLGAALLAGQAHACTVFLLNCSNLRWAPVSGRTNDFMPPAEVGWRMDVVPPGTHAGTPPCPTCKATTFATKYGYAGHTALGGSIMNDGMNSEGLAAGLLWLEKTPFEIIFDPAGPKHAIAWLDVVPFLLGNFGTVQEALAWLMGDEVQVTTSLPPAPYQKVLEGLGLRGTQIPLHLSLMDAAGSTALVEFAPNGTQLYRDVPVVTNDPPYPEHEEWHARWAEEVRAAMAAGRGVDILPAPPASYAYLPGSMEAMARDVRMRMLLDAACNANGAYPEREWAPGAGGGGILPETTTAMSVLRSVEIPWGATGQSDPGTFSAGDTVSSILREHATGRYYFRSPGNPRWQGINLKATNWAAYGGQRRVIEMADNAASWWGDLTQPRADACTKPGPALAQA